MEQRVERLERRQDKMADDIVDLKVGLSTLTERVAHLPGKGFIVTAAIGTVAGVTAAIGLLEKLGLLH